MTLHDFENHIDNKILARGRNYHQSGNILSLDYDDGEWVALVEGSEDYTVTVTLSENGEIQSTTCDCPYDMGEYCKHQAAVLYALKEQPVQPPAKHKKAPKGEQLKDVLGALDKQALLSIVLEFAGRDKRIREELLLRYADKPDMTKYARSLIKSAVSAVKHRGYIEYKDAGKATKGADTVLQMADDKIDAGDSLTAALLCIVVLEEMMDLLDCCDDSNGHVGGCICKAIEKTGEAIEVTSQKAEAGVFDAVFRHACGAAYNAWSHWRMELLSAIVPLCKQKENRKRLEAYISDTCKGSEARGGSLSYTCQELQDLQLQIIKRFDGEKAAVSYMESHTENSRFRKLLIEAAISAGQYDKALQLCLDGEWEDEQHAREWKPLRYTIYEKTKNAEEQRKLAKELLIDGDFSYYNKLKALYSKAEWLAVIQGILEIFTGNNRHGIYVKILVQEKLKLRLLEYCKQFPSRITSYYEQLLPECAKEVGEILLKQVRESAPRASTRGMYRDVCELIRCYGKACGQEKAYAVRDELRGAHQRQPAFLDEMSKL